MTIDTEQLEIDLHALMMQTERDQAEFARQLHIHGQIRQATARLSASNSATLQTLIGHMTAATQADHQEFYEEPSIAERFAPPLRSEEQARTIFNHLQ